MFGGPTEEQLEGLSDQFHGYGYWKPIRRLTEEDLNRHIASFHERYPVEVANHPLTKEEYEKYLEEEKMVPFINTYRGHRFTFDPIDPDAIDIWDIAHALSHQCRFAGHTNMLYSVAQHSLLIAEKVPGSSDDKLNALLHDATEAYVCDIPSPLKKVIGGRYDGLHNAILSAIYHKYMGPTEFQPRAIVKAYDEVAVTFEAQAFFGLEVGELAEHGFNVKAVGSWHPWDPKEFASRTADAEPGMVTAEFLRVFEELMQATGRSPE